MTRKSIAKAHKNSKRPTLCQIIRSPRRTISSTSMTKSLRLKDLPVECFMTKSNTPPCTTDVRYAELEQFQLSITIFQSRSIQLSQLLQAISFHLAPSAIMQKRKKAIVFWFMPILTVFPTMSPGYLQRSFHLIQSQ